MQILSHGAILHSDGLVWSARSVPALSSSGRVFSSVKDAIN
ncbi:hypothetical protein MRBBS_1344 [Marinobacter sp. BSs20148]|nr:hypothetical protein MRBBS_1344 [Marinobacter sp. BSs20148]